jgi:hypothetical protein
MQGLSVSDCGEAKSDSPWSITVTIYPCRGVGSWLTPDLYQAEQRQGISLWAGPTSMIA